MIWNSSGLHIDLAMKTITRLVDFSTLVMSKQPPLLLSHSAGRSENSEPTDSQLPFQEL